MSLEERRLLTDVVGLYKIINSKIDSPELLAQVSFNVPQRNLRGRTLFVLPFSRTNSSLNSPFSRMFKYSNSLCDEIDFFFDYFYTFRKKLKRLAINNI